MLSLSPLALDLKKGEKPLLQNKSINEYYIIFCDFDNRAGRFSMSFLLSITLSFDRMLCNAITIYVHVRVCITALTHAPA